MNVFDENIIYQDTGGGKLPILVFRDKNDEAISFQTYLHPELREDRDICGGYDLKGHGMSVTARNSEGRYLPFKNFDHQVCELGPGLSGILPQHAHRFVKPPIVIEPCPYKQLYPLAQRTEEVLHDGSLEKEFCSIRSVRYLKKLSTVVRKNIAFYLDAESPIRLFRGTFRDIVKGHPELHGILDEKPHHSFSAQYYDYVDGNGFGELIGGGKSLDDNPSFSFLTKTMMK